MLAFVTSLRARALARDWDYHTWLLQSTLDSMLAQTHPAFRVVLVCHDVPELPQLRDPRVQVLQVDFPPPTRNNDDMCVDKVKKISRGAECAIGMGCRFVMFADADDLVCRQLAAWVYGRADSFGWFFETGYRYRHGRSWLARQSAHHLKCGTCAIFRSDLLRFEKDAFYGSDRVNTLAATGHHLYRDKMLHAGKPLSPLPFPGSVYVIHPDSTSDVPGGQGSRMPPRSDRPLWRSCLAALKRAVRDLRVARPVTAKLRREFTIPLPQDVPLEFRRP